MPDCMMYCIKSSRLSIMEWYGGALSGCQPLAGILLFARWLEHNQLQFGVLLHRGLGWHGSKQLGVSVLSLFKDPGHCVKVEYPATSEHSGVPWDEAV